jgi:GNAT superfamily N-acetyltransferase
LVLSTGIIDHLDNPDKNYGFEGPAFPSVYLWYIAVQREMQGGGLGTLLLMDAIRKVYEISRHAGVFALTLTSIDQGRTQKFYERLGFRVYGPTSVRPFMLLPIQSIVDLVEQTGG